MIDVSNLKDALETLGFVAHGDIHEKVFPEIGCSLKVDFQAKRLIYPNEIKGRERNNGFDKKENFVVFECVCRLLLKEYLLKEKLIVPTAKYAMEDIHTLLREISLLRK